MDGWGQEADRSDLVRLAVQLIIEEVLEAEARDKLGRERYERAEGVRLSLGFVEARDRKTAEAAVAKQFDISEEERTRLVCRIGINPALIRLLPPPALDHLRDLCNETASTDDRRLLPQGVGGLATL